MVSSDFAGRLHTRCWSVVPDELGQGRSNRNVVGCHNDCNGGGPRQVEMGRIVRVARGCSHAQNGGKVQADGAGTKAPTGGYTLSQYFSICVYDGRSLCRVGMGCNASKGSDAT